MLRLGICWGLTCRSRACSLCGMTKEELIQYYVRNGNQTAARELLDSMTARELRVFESTVRDVQREIALAQIRKGA